MLEQPGRLRIGSEVLCGEVQGDQAMGRRRQLVQQPGVALVRRRPTRLAGPDRVVEHDHELVLCSCAVALV